MSEKVIMEWLTNYVRVDEVSISYVKPVQEWKSNPRQHRSAVAWNIVQKARRCKLKKKNPRPKKIECMKFSLFSLQ